MPSIRRSKNLKQYAANLLYEVPAGKSSSLSVAFVNPNKTTLFVQTDEISTDFVLSGPSVGLLLQPNHAYTASNVGLDTFNQNLYFTTTASTFVDIAAQSSVHIGYRFGYILESDVKTLIELKVLFVGYYLRSLPVLDYLADASKTNGSFILENGTPKIFKGVTQASTLRTGGNGYSSSVAYWNAGGAVYDTYGFGVNSQGYLAGYNTLNSSSQNTAASINVTSGAGANSPYGIAEGTARLIHPGSPQVFFLGNAAVFWVSSYGAAQKPASIWTYVGSLTSTTWSSLPISYPESVNNERLTWMREASGYYYTGSDQGCIYSSASVQGTQTKIPTPPADVNIAHPPIRLNNNKLAFASLSGNHVYHIMTVGSTHLDNTIQPIPLYRKSSFDFCFCGFWDRPCLF
jgi:hypothetical protein